MSFALNGQIGKNKKKNKGRAQSNSCFTLTGKEMTLSDGMRCQTRSGEAKARRLPFGPFSIIYTFLLGCVFTSRIILLYLIPLLENFLLFFPSLLPSS